MIDPDLLDILACPVCKVKVRLEGDGLVCDDCRRRYPIEDGIPIMLADEARIDSAEATEEGEESS